MLEKKQSNYKGHPFDSSFASSESLRAGCETQRLFQFSPSHRCVSLRPLRLKFFLLLLCTGLLSCSHRSNANTLTMIIESSPANLDPRVGTDAQSERIDALIFDSLVHRDEHFNIVPW